MGAVPQRPETSYLETENLMSDLTSRPMNKQRPACALPAPSFLDRWQALLAISLLFLIPFFLPIPMELRRHPLIGHLGDQVHVPFLMILTLLMYWKGPFACRLKGAVLAGVILGAGIELLQLLVGRAANVADFVLDLAGIGMALGLVFWKGYKKSWGLGLICGIALLLSAQLYFLPGLIMGSYQTRQAFPLISDFNNPQEHWLWHGTYDAAVDLILIDDSPTGEGMVLQLESGPPSKWPGAKMQHFPHDWSQYKTLKVDVRHVTENREQVPFSLRLDDFQSRLKLDWASKSFIATNQWKTFSMPIDEPKVSHGDRSLNMEDLSHFLIFLSDKNDSTVIQVDNIRLE